jgi:hypothetical protein
MVDVHDWERNFNLSDCDSKCECVMARLQDHFDRKTNPFWPYFLKQRNHARSQGLSDLRVLHNYVSTLRELLEELQDRQTLALLEDLEETCM